MKFEEVAGQDGIRERLIQSVQTNRVSHALLFSGQPGSGHFAMALAFAQYLQCRDRGERDSCGVCPSCHQAQQHIHPDIHYVFPVARTAGFKAGEEPYSDRFLEAWRDYLTGHPSPSLQEWYRTIGIENQQAGIFKREAQEILKKLSFKAYESEYKVLIIWMPEKMHAVAANKLLKIIEEPPEKTVFLLVSDHPEEILPTISSRAQMIRVPVIRDKSLQARIGGEEQLAEFRQHFISWMRLIYKVEIGPLQQLIQKLA
ncbi:MAG: DNA polymerase III subunit delta, partial [Bacteroidales bacterium]|nr:DNA polymerase III subunit delta [Bacteroidales bacterium]